MISMDNLKLKIKNSIIENGLQYSWIINAIALVMLYIVGFSYINSNTTRYYMIYSVVLLLAANIYILNVLTNSKPEKTSE